MNKRIILIVIGSLFLIAATAGSFFLSNTTKQNTQPTVTPAESPDSSTTQNTTEAQDPVTRLSGTFASVGAKTGSGSVSLIIEDNVSRIELGEDFTVQEGPDLFVGFGNNGAIDTATLVAPLKSTSGAQTYEVPATINATNYKQVFVYCKEYATVFSVATLN